MDWGYSEADRAVGLMRGRVLGGSSTTNASAAVRGQPASFDAWGEGWTWDDCLPALRAVETDAQFGDADYHGSDGPIRITRLSYGPIDEAFASACARRVTPPARDHNAPARSIPVDRATAPRCCPSPLRPGPPARPGCGCPRLTLPLEIAGPRVTKVVLRRPDGPERIARPVHLVSEPRLRDAPSCGCAPAWAPRPSSRPRASPR